jgi:hypothetical protein
MLAAESRVSDQCDTETRTECATEPDRQFLLELSKAWQSGMSKLLNKVVVNNERTDDSYVAKVLVKDGLIDISKEIWQLKPGKWLNNVVINAYLYLIYRDATKLIADPLLIY